MKKNPIILVNPNWSEGSIFESLVAKAPPLGLAYIGAVLEKNNFNVQIIDMKVEKISFEDLKLRVSHIKPLIFGISISAGQVDSGTKIIKFVKKNSPKTICIIGGSHASALPIRTLKETNADICVYGEGEITMFELAKAIYNNKEINSIKGIVYRKGNSIIKNPPKELIDDIDKLPFPARHLLPPLILYQGSQEALSKHHTTMMTSRGCIYRCAFCDKSVFGKTLRLRNVKSVVDEIEELIKKENIKSIRFFDDSFTAVPKRLKDLCNEIVKRKIKIKWSCDARVNNVSLEMLKMMKKSGCVEIHYGIESGNQKILDLLQKDITLEEIRNAIKWTNKAKIEPRGNFMIGFPTDTRETILETIKFGKSLNLTHANLTFYSPYPKTFDVSGYGKVIAKSWSDYVQYERPIFIPNGMTEEELIKLYKKANLEMHLNPRRILKILKKIKNFSTLKYFIKAFFWGLKKK